MAENSCQRQTRARLQPLILHRADPAHFQGVEQSDLEIGIRLAANHQGVFALGDPSLALAGYRLADIKLAPHGGDFIDRDRAAILLGKAFAVERQPAVADKIVRIFGQARGRKLDRRSARKPRPQRFAHRRVRHARGVDTHVIHVHLTRRQGGKVLANLCLGGIDNLAERFSTNSGRTIQSVQPGTLWFVEAPIEGSQHLLRLGKQICSAAFISRQEGRGVTTGIQGDQGIGFRRDRAIGCWQFRHDRLRK